MLGIKDILHHVQLAFFILTKSHVAQTDCPQIRYIVEDDLELLVLQSAEPGLRVAGIKPRALCLLPPTPSNWNCCVEHTEAS